MFSNFHYAFKKKKLMTLKFELEFKRYKYGCTRKLCSLYLSQL